MWVQSLFIALFIVIILQGVYFSKRNFKSIRYRRHFTPNEANVGETVTLVEHIENTRLLPIPWVRVEASISSDLIIGRSKSKDKLRQFHRSMFALPPYSTITRRHPVYCSHRGYYHIPTVSLTTGDVLGISDRKSRDIPTDTTLLVYPNIVPIEDIFSIRNSFTGDVVVRRWIVEDPFLIKGVRDYASGDPQNHINWKATARVGRLQVHNYDYSADVRLMIMLNVETEDGQWTVTRDPECVEREISYAASIAQYALENGVETGFSTNGKYIDDPETQVRLTPYTSAEQLNSLLLALAKLTHNRRQTFQKLLEMEADEGLTGCDILIISAYTCEEIDEQVERLRGLGNAVEFLMVEPTPPEELDRGAVS
ncbi:MAG: DUF58 domain-containing protein [Clostridia bacterium]|nr:DUF58 domain-containing protein [Clostridia bacterium]